MGAACASSVVAHPEHAQRKLVDDFIANVPLGS